MKLYVLLILNKINNRKSLLSIAGQTAVFDSEKEALGEGERLFGRDNPSVSYSALPLN